MKNITYKLPIVTEKQMAHAERRQREAYSHYNSVQVVPVGLTHVNIICSEPRQLTGIDLILS